MARKVDGPAGVKPDNAVRSAVQEFNRDLKQKKAEVQVALRQAQGKAPRYGIGPAYQVSTYAVTHPGDAKGKPPTFAAGTRGTPLAPGLRITATDRAYVVDQAGTIHRETPKPRLSKKARRKVRRAAGAVR